MKLGKKQQIAILAAVLVLVAAGGTAVFLLTGKDSPKPESSLQAEPSDMEASQTTEKKALLPNGLYHEQPVQEDSYFGDIFSDSQGKIVWLKYANGGTAFVDNSGNPVVEIPDIDSPEDSLNISTLDFNGNLVSGYVENDTHIVHISRYDSDGSIDRTAELKGQHSPTEENPYFELFEFLADENYLYLVTISGTQRPVLQVYDWDGNLIVEYEDTDDVAIDGKGTFYCLTQSLQQAQTPEVLLKYDLSTGEETVETPIWDFAYQVEYNRYDERVYLATEKGVAAYFPGVRNNSDSSNKANFQYILAMGEDTSFFADNMSYLRDFAIAEDRTLYFDFMGFEGEGENFRSYQQVIPFTFEEGAVREEKEPTFTVTVPYASEFLKETAIRFEKQNPEEHIEIDAAYPSEDSYLKSFDLYRDRISTRILAGDVGDLVSLSGERLPVQNFLQSDALLDLTPYLEQSGLSPTWNPAVLEAVKMNGSIRGLPVTYYVPCLVADGKLAEEMGVDLQSLQNWADIFGLLPKWKEAAPEAPLFNGYKNQLAWAMLDSCLPKLIDVEQKTVSLDQDWFRETLEAFKSVNKDPMFVKSQEFSITDRLMGGLFAVADLGGQARLTDEFSRSTVVPDQRYLPMPECQIFQSGEIYGIAASSDNPDSAWNFLSYLYSEQAQTLFSRPEIPVIQAGWDTFKEGESYYDSPADQQRMAEFETITKGADTVKLQNDITDLFAVHFQKYLNDQETMDEMLQAAEDEIWLYLNE